MTTAAAGSAQVSSMLARSVEHLNRNEISEAETLLSGVIAIHPDIKLEM